MATQIQHRRGSTAQHATFTGAIGEITVDTTKKVAVVHDGSTAGGVPLAREDQKNEGAFGYAQEVKTDNYAVAASDAGKMLIANKATAIIFTLGAAASLTSKFVAVFKNINAGTLSIAPTGAELIDGVNASITIPTGASVIVKCDGASFRTYLSNGDVTGNAINTAPALTGANLADNDKLGVVDVSAGTLVSVLFSEMIAGVFKTARTIANAQFAAASFKLYNAAGTPRALTFDTTALTADRTITIPDGDITLGGSINISVYTSSATYTKPVGLKNVLSIPVGGSGGGGGTVNGGNGGTSSFGSHCSATGGNGGVSSGANAVTTAGVGTGGLLNVTGQAGPPVPTVGKPSAGGMAAFGMGSGGAAGASGAAAGAGGGGALKFIDAASVGSTEAVTVGAGGTAGGGAGQVGDKGVVIVWEFF